MWRGMKNKFKKTGTEFGNTSCMPKSRKNELSSTLDGRRARCHIEAEIKLIQQLLHIVNTKEEYELLERDLAELERLYPLISSSSLKGGAALICR